jgi:hypothetical protein
VPHVELIDAVTLPQFHARFRPRTLREGERVFRVLSSFLAHDARSLLLECVVVEGHLRQSFFMLLAAHESSTMLRLLPRTSPEKTEGVTRCLAWVAAWLAEESPNSRVGRTNLQGLIPRPKPPHNPMPS